MRRRTERQGRRRAWTSRVLALAFGLVLLLLVELGLRAGGMRPAYRPEALGQWRVEAGLRDQLMQGPRDGHAFRLSTNDDGLRTELPRERRPGVPRVALLGDSTVFGWGVGDDETLAAGVAVGLPGVEVLNAGQPGYSTTQAAWLLSQVVVHYAPDLAILFIPMHDHNLVLVSDREVLEGGRGLVAKLRVGLARHSALYQGLRGLLFPATEQPFLLPTQATKEPRVPRVSDEERSRALLEARAAVEPGEVAVGWLPFEADIRGGRAQDRPSGPWVREMAAEHGVPVVDVRACCQGEGLVLADDPGHLSAEGNRVAGLAIARVLEPLLQKTR